MRFTYSEIKMFVFPSTISLNSSNDFQFSLSKEKHFSQCKTFSTAFYLFYRKKNLELKADIFQIVNLSELIIFL